MKKILIVFCLIFIMPFSVFTQEPDNMKLSAPDTQGGMPLMQALSQRKSTRKFSDKKLSSQELSNLLWAAAGINRPEQGYRTAPTAKNMQEIDIYLALEEGLYLYEPVGHSLKLILKKDLRSITGKQEFAAQAPLNLIFVADFTKMKNLTEKEAEFYAAIDTGFVSQNVYLFCASQNLATVVRGYLDKGALAKAMGLKVGQQVVVAQSVGYFKD